MKLKLLPSTTRPGRRLGILALLLAGATTLAGPVTSANAALTPISSAKTTSTATSPQIPTKIPANAAVANGKTARRQITKPQQPKKDVDPGAFTAAQLAARAATARGIIAHSTVPNTCSGAISPDTVYPCSTPSSTGTDTFTVTVSSAHDLLIFNVLSTNYTQLPISITPSGGTATACTVPTYGQLPACVTSAAGTYTIQITNYGVDYTIAYMALLSDSSCTAADPSFASSTPVQGSIAGGSAGACVSLNVASGHIVTATLQSQFGNALVTIYDSTGAAICNGNQGNCTLTGTGPYRVLVTYVSGGSSSYGLLLKDIVDPAGCVAAPQGEYGTALSSLSPSLCRTLTVTSAGEYQISAVSSVYGSLGGALYTPAGAAACTNSGIFCQLTAGTYNLVIGVLPTSTDTFGVIFIAANESSGCVASGDSDFQSGDATGTFAGLGAEVCLTLPTASGKSDFIDNQMNSNATYGQVLYALDATGAQQCSSADFSYLVTCAFTGTAPFRVILAAGGQNTSGIGDTAYRLLVQRTDSTVGCAAWPQSGYGGTWGASVSLTKSNNFGCLSIPAAQHSTGEMVDYANNANSVDGSINVYGPTGNQVCVGASTAVCSYTAGVSYLALIYFSSPSGVTGDTFHVVRRDVSQTASCSTPASTTVGGPSTSFDLTSDLDAFCERVTAATGDRLYFSVRTESPYQTGAVLMVANAQGSIVCRQWGTLGCPVSGSTSYQVILVAENYNGVAIAAHLDSLRVGTASGWASQCTAHSLSTEGWAPITSTLSDNAASYCAVIARGSNQQWNIDGADTAVAPEEPQVRVFSTTDWTQGYGICTGNPTTGCDPLGNDTGQAVLIETMDTIKGSASVTLQGVCTIGCTTQPAFPTISSVSAASQPQAEANSLVVHGTNLNLGTDLQFLTNGSLDYTASATEESVSADGTSATYSVNTLEATPGKYDLGISETGSPFCPTGQTSAQCLYGAYTVTVGRGANSTFVPVTPKRILDSRIGLGAPKKQIAAYGSIPLTVTGVDGVPTSGVTAVDVELTPVNEAQGGNLTAYPYGATRPATSDLNFNKGQVITNLATVPVSQGKIELYNGSNGAVDLIADIVGYYTTSATGSLYTGVTPTRILSTAGGLGVAKGKVVGGGAVPVTVTGVGGVPNSGVTAVALNVTVSDATAGGYLIAYPYGAARPGVTDLTYPATQSTRSLIVVPVVQGKIELYNAGGSPVDLSADIEGYYSATGSGFQPLGPERVLDTRSGLGAAGATVPSDGVATLPVSALTNVPGSASSVVLNVVVVGAQTAGTLTVTQDGMALPGLADLAYGPGGALAGQVIVPAGGTLDFYNGSGGTVQVVADVEGYFTS